MAAAGAARVVLPHLMGDRHPRLQRHRRSQRCLKRPLWLIAGNQSSSRQQVAAVARRVEQIAKAGV